MKKYLFVCLRGAVRSPIASNYFSRLLSQKGLEGAVEFAGISSRWTFFSKQKKYLTQKQCEEADVIFVMDKFMKQKLLCRFNSQVDLDGKKIIDLNILDYFWYNGRFMKPVAYFARLIKKSESRQLTNQWLNSHYGVPLQEILKQKHLEQYI